MSRPHDDVGNIGLGFDAVHFTLLDDCVDGGGAFGAETASEFPASPRFALASLIGAIALPMPDL